MKKTDHSEFDEQLPDRLVDMMLNETIGERTPPDLADAIVDAVARRRRLERVPIALAIAASIAAILAHFGSRLLTRPEPARPSDIARQEPTIPAPVPPGARSPAEPPPVVTPPDRGPAVAVSPGKTPREVPPPAAPEEYVAEAKRWPPTVELPPRVRTATPVALPQEHWKKLPQIEAHKLAKADAYFRKESYRAAVAAFDAFLIEFPRSKVMPYVILMKGRALHKDEKRFLAINTYQEVLDYFPSAIEFAAPALFYIGQCHSQNGDAEKAMKAWLEMATDKDYRKHDLAAHAMNGLADELWRRTKLTEALKYYRQVVADFRQTVPAAGRHAVLQVARYHILIEPDEARVREWYREAGTFSPVTRELATDTDLSRDAGYWASVMRLVREGAESFPEARAHMRRQCLAYWIAIFDSRMPPNENLLVALADLRRSHTGDGAAWVREMDAIFASGYKPGDINRVLRWVDYFRELPDEAARYCAKVDPEDKTVAVMEGDAKAALAVKLGAYDAAVARRIISLVPGEGRRLKALVDYYHSLGPDAGKDRLPLNLDAAALPRERIRAAAELADTKGFGKHGLWRKAQFLHWNKQYKEAIAAYRACDNPPRNSWPIVECLEALGDWQQAIQELQQMEAFFLSVAPKAALMQSQIYGKIGERDKQIMVLRRIMKTYRKHSASRMAHQRLERMGMPIGGGLDAGEEVKEEKDE